MPKSVTERKRHEVPFYLYQYGCTLRSLPKRVLIFVLLASAGVGYWRSVPPTSPSCLQDAKANATTTTIATTTTTTTSVTKMPLNPGRINIQVAVTTSVNGLEYAMRMWANTIDNGWHQDFGPQIPIYTFDEIPVTSPLNKFVTSLKPVHPNEPTKQNNNLLSASLQHLYNDINPDADWYLLTEDDTIVIRENLEYYIDQAFSNVDPKTVEEIRGVCVGTDITFVVGGSGILLSAALVQALVPHLDACRRNPEILQARYGDERIGACLAKVMGRNRYQWCVNEVVFGNYNVYEMIQHFNDNNNPKFGYRIATLHEKNPQRIQGLQKWIRSRPADQVTLENMHKDVQLMQFLKDTE